MELDEAQRSANALRERFAAYERSRSVEWTNADLLVGLSADIGDLARLMQEFDGRREARVGLDQALAHEVGDCLWAILAIASRAGVDAGQAYAGMLSEAGAWLSSQGV